MKKFIFKVYCLSFFFRFTKVLLSYFLQYDPKKKIITHSELYFEQRFVYCINCLLVARSFFDLELKGSPQKYHDDTYYKSIRMTIAIFLGSDKVLQIPILPITTTNTVSWKWKNIAMKQGVVAWIFELEITLDENLDISYFNFWSKLLTSNRSF